MWLPKVHDKRLEGRNVLVTLWNWCGGAVGMGGNACLRGDLGKRARVRRKNIPIGLGLWMTGCAIITPVHVGGSPEACGGILRTDQEATEFSPISRDKKQQEPLFHGGKDQITLVKGVFGRIGYFRDRDQRTWGNRPAIGIRFLVRRRYTGRHTCLLPQKPVGLPKTLEK